MGAETLKRLATKTLVPNGEGFGGIVSLQPCDVAYGLSGLPSGPAALLRAMYAGDHGQHNMAYLYKWAITEAEHLTGHAMARRLAIRAIDELVHRHTLLCQKCNGTGRIQPNQHNPNGDCPRCGTSGRRVPTDADMADELGVTVKQWREAMQTFARISSELQCVHDESVRHFNGRLAND